MLPSFLLSLREGLEAALIIGVVLGALRKMDRSKSAGVVWWGVFSAAIVSVLAGIALFALGASLEGAAEQVFEGITMLLAASILTWMIFWMSRQASTLKRELEADVRLASLKTGNWALFSLAFLAVVREGVELALFLTATSFAADASQTWIGALLGLSASALLGMILFASTIRLDIRHFFQITSVLLILFAAGLVAHGVHEFNEAGWIPPIVESVWNSNALLDEKSLVGEMLKALFGYNGNPSLSEALAYFGYFAAIIIGFRRRNVALSVAQKL